MTDLARKLRNEIYLIAPNGTVAARRSPRVLDVDELKIAARPFKKQQKKNILFTKYKGEPLLISCSLCASSGFLVAIIPYCSVGAMLRYVSSAGGDDIAVSEELFKETDRKKLSQDELDTIYETFSLLKAFDVGFGILQRSCSSRLTAIAAARARNIAELVGCRLELEPVYVSGECEHFDLCFFSAFMLCVSMLTRRVSVDRSVAVSFFKMGDGLAVRAETVCASDFELQELRELKSFAEANGIYFLTDVKNGIALIETCPARPDTSKLGLKSNDIFLE